MGNDSLTCHNQSLQSSGLVDCREIQIASRFKLVKLNIMGVGYYRDISLPIVKTRL